MIIMGFLGFVYIYVLVGRKLGLAGKSVFNIDIHLLMKPLGEGFGLYPYMLLRIILYALIYLELYRKTY